MVCTRIHVHHTRADHLIFVLRTRTRTRILRMCLRAHTFLRSASDTQQRGMRHRANNTHSGTAQHKHTKRHTVSRQTRAHALALSTRSARRTCPRASSRGKARPMFPAARTKARDSALRPRPRSPTGRAQEAQEACCRRRGVAQSAYRPRRARLRRAGAGQQQEDCAARQYMRRGGTAAVARHLGSCPRFVKSTCS